MVGLTKTLAKEWGRLNIRCNAIAFGAIDTRLTRGREGADQSILVGGKRAVSLGIPNADQYLAAVKNAVPLGRIGSVDDAAGAILLMASPYASYITGQVLEVNGGAYM